MFDYVMLATDDVARAEQFYDPLMAIRGYPRCWTKERSAAWRSFDDPTKVALCIQKPFDGEPATVGNGVMLALRAALTAMVDSLHAAAVAHGGHDEGCPVPAYNMETASTPLVSATRTAISSPLLTQCW
ncbi:VOC family protein [Haematobacter missouriensis]|uniref:VOC family protein n=1 Tax=Haematobacter missouriensis TaxID=366616 RepID=UPI001E31456D|nr:VOC family protein [Haematobacter missouriensis]